MRVALVSVGDELLTGDTVNTNAAWLGRELSDRGVAVERTTVVPDRTADIARVVNEYHAEYDAVVVTGGLGPTHDDVTIEGVAAAFGPRRRRESGRYRLAGGTRRLLAGGPDRGDGSRPGGRPDPGEPRGRRPPAVSS